LVDPSGEDNSTDGDGHGAIAAGESAIPCPDGMTDEFKPLAVFGLICTAQEFIPPLTAMGY
jgi:hypothetical protein